MRSRIATLSPYVWTSAVLLSFGATTTSAAEPAKAPEKAAAPDIAVEGDPEGFTRLAKDYELWIEVKRKLLVVDGYVCLREGFLEMFACPQGSKEHESIVAVNSKASFVHAGLLAIGAKPGHPVRFQPEYVPADGAVVDVFVLWKDQDGKEHRQPAQEWIRNTKTGETMQYTWVFAGSGFWMDEQSGKRYYYGDAGDFICVSNFPTATLDLPVASSQDNSNLTFAAFTERIPPLRTKVRLVLAPRLDSDTKEKDSSAAEAVEGAEKPGEPAETEADAADPTE